MAYSLIELPYSQDALAPVLSDETFAFHFGKHYKTYVTTLNQLIAGSEHESLPLLELVQTVAGASAETNPKDAKIFNNAAQAWNHEFYFIGLAPKGKTAPSTTLTAVLSEAFGSFDGFKKKFAEAAVSQFGSGWAWLVRDKGGKLAIRKTPDAHTPAAEGEIPLLTCDVWEHAYYIDYRNDRERYVDAYFDIVNWDLVETKLDRLDAGPK